MSMRKSAALLQGDIGECLLRKSFRLILIILRLTFKRNFLLCLGRKSISALSRTSIYLDWSIVVLHKLTYLNRVLVLIRPTILGNHPLLCLRRAIRVFTIHTVVGLLLLLLVNVEVMRRQLWRTIHVLYRLDPHPEVWIHHFFILISQVLYIRVPIDASTTTSQSLVLLNGKLLVLALTLLQEVVLMALLLVRDHNLDQFTISCNLCWGMLGFVVFGHFVLRGWEAYYLGQRGVVFRFVFRHFFGRLLLHLNLMICLELAMAR